MNAILAEWPILALLLVGFLPNEVWRALGLVLSRGLDEESQIVVWVRAVATAILAGVLAQLVLSTAGALSTVPLPVRIAATAAGFFSFVLLRRSVFAGVLGAEIVLILGALMFEPA